MAVNTPDIAPLIQEAVARLLLAPLEQESTALGLGCRFFDTSSPLSVPKISGSFSPDWTGESEEITEDDGVNFGSVSLLPSSMKSVKTLIRLSAESLRMSTQALDSVLGARLLRDVATKIDSQFFSALGDGVLTPQGLLAWAGTQKTAIGGPLTVDALFDAAAVALGSHLAQTRLTWVMHPTVFSSLRKVKVSSGGYLLQSDLTADGTYRLLGSRIVLTDRLPASSVVLLDPSVVAVARDLAPTAVVDRSRYFEFDEIAIRVVSRYDFKPLDPSGVIILTGVQPALPDVNGTESDL